MKIIASLALAALALTSASAQENTPKLSVLSDIKFSGYVMARTQRKAILSIYVWCVWHLKAD